MFCLPLCLGVQMASMVTPPPGPRWVVDPVCARAVQEVGISTQTLVHLMNADNRSFVIVTQNMRVSFHALKKKLFITSSRTLFM